MTFKKICCKGSSALEEISYDDYNQIMRIKYLKATQYYDFLSVTLEDIHEVTSAESVGKVVHKIVKGKTFIKSDF